MKPVFKIIKWFFLLLFVIMAFSSIASMAGGEKDSIWVLIFSVICVALILLLPKRHGQNTVTEQTKPVRETVSKVKFTRYKGFPIDNFHISYLSGLFIFNEEFDYSISQIKENGLEDSEIYKFEFHLKPEFTRSESGALQIMAEGRMIGDLSEKTALEMKEFINSHENCRPSLEINGGTFKYYDSFTEELTTDKEPWTATLMVSYYE